MSSTTIKKIYEADKLLISLIYHHIILSSHAGPRKKTAVASPRPRPAQPEASPALQRRPLRILL